MSLRSRDGLRLSKRKLAVSLHNVQRGLGTIVRSVGLVSPWPCALASLYDPAALPTIYARKQLHAAACPSEACLESVSLDVPASQRALSHPTQLNAVVLVTEPGSGPVSSSKRRGPPPLVARFLRLFANSLRFIGFFGFLNPALQPTRTSPG